MSNTKDRIVALFIAVLLCSTTLIKAQEPTYDFIVAKDGTGDYSTVQEAIMAVPDFRKSKTQILIKNGIYKEKLVLPASKTNVTFIGESRDQVYL